MNPEFNFIHKDLPDSDRDLFFGPLTENDKFIVFDDGVIMAHLIAQIGLFTSIGQARKNGWDKPIPIGYTDLIVGKKKIYVTILNKF